MAGRIQLATTGPQDQFFTLNPQYTHFKENFRKHSNFSTEFVDVESEQTVDFGTVARFRIANNIGDLIRTVSFKFTLPGLNQTHVGYIESVGHALIEHVDLIVGGQLVQRVTSDWFEMYSEHYYTHTKQNALFYLTGKCPVRAAGVRSNDVSVLAYLGTSTSDVDFYVDVPFYFHREPALAFPLCAVCDAQEVEVEVKLRNVADLVVDVTDGSLPTLTRAHSISSFVMQCEMVFLDNIEKIKFKNTPKDYLITQNQLNHFIIPKNQDVFKCQLSFTNLVRELYFVIQSVGARVFDYDNYRQTDLDGKLVQYEHLKYLTLTLDGGEVLTRKTGSVAFLKSVQAAIHHAKTQIIRRFYSYSFALEPEKAQPSGQINFSVIKDQNLELALNRNALQDRNLRVYARSFNILRVSGGNARVIFNVQY